MEFVPTTLSEVILIKPKVYTDERGFFLESYKKSVWVAHGITEEFVQDNHSKSVYGVLRGLHYQLLPNAQAKLVRCTRGAIFDVAIDIRKKSPTFGQWVGYELSEDNKNMLYIPVGFAHGFLTLTDTAELLYKTTAEYMNCDDRGIKFDDPDIGIKWPISNDKILLSAKDKVLPNLKFAENNFI